MEYILPGLVVAIIAAVVVIVLIGIRRVTCSHPFEKRVRRNRGRGALSGALFAAEGFVDVCTRCGATVGRS